MLTDIIAHLKCSICKEYFNAAMSLPCSHTFCSKCIRVHLSSKSNCPSCLKQVKGIFELRNDRVVDSIVEIVKGNDENRVATVDKEDIEPLGNLPYFILDDEPVQCPVCNIYVIFKDLNSHLDFGCKSGSNSNFFRKKFKKRSFKASVPYSCYNDKELRKLLSSDGISSTGDRQSLIKRHTEFLNIHNSNLDRLDPQPQKWVISQVEDWEKNLSVKSVVLNNHLEMYKQEYDGLIQQIKSRKRARSQNEDSDQIL